MGYTTNFSGEFVLNNPLSSKHEEYLRKFASTRRMKRDASKTALRPDPVREAVGLPVGVDGGYFVGAGGSFGQENMLGNPAADDVIDHNREPSGQPGLWCQWVPSHDGEAIEWNGGEKFYNYVEWLEYIIEHFLKPWGYVLNGTVTWEGEEQGDVGKIIVNDNVVTTKQARLVWE
jgi:hypothetical protein